jgi:hypothetical protein
MPAPEQKTALAPSNAASTASQKLLQLLRKRLRQLLWCLLGLAVAAGVFGIWWLNSLSGLPDIGDPFDVAAFTSTQIPDDQNGLAFLQQALNKLTPRPAASNSVITAAATGSWSQLDPALQNWVEVNRPAIELFLRGADRPDVLWNLADEFFWQRYPMVNPGGLMWLVLVEGGRRAESGDMAGAWDCYRAVLRMTTHLRRRGDMTLRVIVGSLHNDLRRRLAEWVANPKTTIPQLRRALDEVLPSEPKLEWDVASLKNGYLNLSRMLDSPRYSLHRAMDGDANYRLGNFQVPSDWAMYVFLGERFLRHEPERSKRAIRLLFANWLAHLEGPNPRHTSPAVRVSFSRKNSPDSVVLYPVSPQAPAGARRLSPRDLASWLVTILDAKPFLWVSHWPSYSLRERRGYRQLLILIADELYRREHGGILSSDEALLGTYLKTIPDDNSVELGDGSTPVVSD